MKPPYSEFAYKLNETVSIIKKNRKSFIVDKTKMEKLERSNFNELHLVSCFLFENWFTSLPRFFFFASEGFSQRCWMVAICRLLSHYRDHYTMTEGKRNAQPVAAGCVVTYADIPNVVISFTCFAAFILYGASNAALGASVPALSRALDKSESKIGFIFMFRGAGFLTGTLGSAALLSFSSLPLSKEVITCLSSVLMGVSTFLMSCTNNYQLVLAFSIFQGLGFGGIDCLSNCIFPDLWGVRIQPWMQALHLCFGIGAMIGPIFVGSLGYTAAYRILGVGALFPLAALQGYRILDSLFSISTNESRNASLSSSSNDSDTTFDSSVSKSSLEPLAKHSATNGSNAASNGASKFDYKHISMSVTDDEDEGDATYAPFGTTTRSSNSGFSNELNDADEERLRRIAVALSKNNGGGDSSTFSSLSGAGGGVAGAGAGAGGVEGSSGKSDSSDVSNDDSTSSGPAYPVTLPLRILIVIFYFLYTGSEAGFGSWIPVYVLEEGMTTNDSQAAYVSATFWAALTVGRMFAVLTAVFFSATFMLRFHLLLTMTCASMFMFVEAVGTLHYAMVVAASMGLAMSAIYPLVMTIVVDYGYTM
jgi:fucose permease